MSSAPSSTHVTSTLCGLSAMMQPSVKPSMSTLYPSPSGSQTEIVVVPVDDSATDIAQEGRMAVRDDPSLSVPRDVENSLYQEGKRNNSVMSMPIALEDGDDQDRTRNNSVVTLSSNPCPEPRKAKNASSLPPSPPPFQARFFSKNRDTLIKTRTYMKIMGMGTFMTILVIFGVLSIYWASLYNVDKYIHRLDGWIIDFDGGQIGEAVIQAFQNNTGDPEQMTWRVVDASQFSNLPDDIEVAVVGEKVWTAITINREASSNLSNAIATADFSYNGSYAVTAWVNEARNENAYSSFIQPITSMILAKVAETFAMENSRRLGANNSVDLPTLLSEAPSVIATPAYYTTVNLRPFDVPVAQAVDFVGLIYLLIISFVVAMMNYNARVGYSGLNQHLKLGSLIIVRITVPIILYFFVSLFFSLLSLAFLAPFDRFYGDSGFVIYWMMNWMGMCALGLAMESTITLLTPAFIAFFLILWMITNTSISSVPIEVLPGIFRYGYATPFYNVSRTVRTVMFGTRNQIGLNFGAQFAWIAVSLVTMTLLTYWMRKREEREWVRQQEIENFAAKEKGIDQSLCQ